MSDYMEQDAERLIQTLESCAVDPMSNGYAEVSKRLLVAAACSLRTLLAHIQRGAVPERNERDEWEAVVFTLMGHAASLYFCGQSDMPNWFYELAEKLARRHVDEALAARVREVGVQQRDMLAAAPAPDQFLDAAKMVTAQPRVETFDVDFLARLGAEVPAPAEVPMPEPVVQNYPSGKWSYHADQMHAYGDAREAAGYARGLRDAVRDAAPLVQNGEVLVTVTGLTGSGKSAIAGEIEIMCRALGLEVEWGEGAAEKHLTHADWTNALEMYRPRVRIVEANIPRTDAALRGKVKP